MRRLVLVPLTAALRTPHWHATTTLTSSTPTATSGTKAALSPVTMVTQQRTSSSLSSSSSSPTRRSRSSGASSSARASPPQGASGDEFAVSLYGDEDAAANAPLSAIDRLAQRRDTVLPWEARRAAVSYKVCSTDWKFLDRALSALMEMDAEEVSTRSVKLSGRDLLSDVVHPVVALRRTAKSRKRGSATARRSRTTRAACVESPVSASVRANQVLDDVCAPVEESGSVRSCETATASTTAHAAGADVVAAVASRRKRGVQKSDIVVPTRTASCPSSSSTGDQSAAVASNKPRRRGKRTTVRL